MSARRFKPYPAYKDSGVEWLGEIPASWVVKRLWHLTPSARRIMYGIVLPGPNVDDGVPIVKGGDVSPDRLRLDRLNRTTREIESGYVRSRLRGGDLVYAIRGSIGEVATVPDEIEGANLTQDAARIAYTPETHGRWLLHALKSTAVFAQLEAGALGATIRGINIRDLKRAPIAVPPHDEQRAIAAFLDRETTRIDALVAKKERLIELLQEKRTALITRAVTKGLDPNVPMKDSGIEWLGEIPAHWEVEENRWLFLESDLRSQAGEEELLTVSHITGVTRRSEKPDVTMIEAESHEGYKVCGRGELAINTMWAWMGALGIAREHGMVSPSYNVYRIAQTRLNPSYYDYVCRVPVHVAEIIRHSKGIWQSRLRLYPDAFREIVTPIPSDSEQRAIAAFLDRETARIDALITKVRDAIDRLKELRTAVISAAVTGKIDVRGSGIN